MGETWWYVAGDVLEPVPSPRPYILAWRPVFLWRVSLHLLVGRPLYLLPGKLIRFAKTVFGLPVMGRERQGYRVCLRLTKTNKYRVALVVPVRVRGMSSGMKDMLMAMELHTHG